MDSIRILFLSVCNRYVLQCVMLQLYAQHAKHSSKRHTLAHVTGKPARTTSRRSGSTTARLTRQSVSCSEMAGPGCMYKNTCTNQAPTRGRKGPRQTNMASRRCGGMQDTTNPTRQCCRSWGGRTHWGHGAKARGFQVSAWFPRKPQGTQAPRRYILWIILYHGSAVFDTLRFRRDLRDSPCGMCHSHHTCVRNTKLRYVTNCNCDGT